MRTNGVLGSRRSAALLLGLDGAFGQGVYDFYRSCADWKSAFSDQLGSDAVGKAQVSSDPGQAIEAQSGGRSYE